MSEPTARLGESAGAVDFEREVNTAQTRDFFVFPPAVLSSEEQTRELLGLVGEWRATFLDDLDLQAGLRQDFNDAFDDAFTYSVGVSYRVPDSGTRLHGTVGRAVTNSSPKAPSAGTSAWSRRCSTGA